MKIKAIVSFLVTLLPFSCVRRFLLNLIPSYKIDRDSRIGFCNFILADELRVCGSSLGSFNRISGNKLSFKRSHIGKLNTIKNAAFFEVIEANVYNRNSFIGTTDECIVGAGKNTFRLGERSLVTHGHYFDLSFGIIVGKNVVFGGEGSQCWTHGYDYKRNMIGGGYI